MTTTLHAADDTVELLELPSDDSTYTVYGTDVEQLGCTFDTLPDSITWKNTLFERSCTWSGFVTYHEPNKDVVLRVHFEW